MAGTGRMDDVVVQQPLPRPPQASPSSTPITLGRPQAGRGSPADGPQSPTVRTCEDTGRASPITVQLSAATEQR